jgi:hypothetical protein
MAACRAEAPTAGRFVVLANRLSAIAYTFIANPLEDLPIKI